MEGRENITLQLAFKVQPFAMASYFSHLFHVHGQHAVGTYYFELFYTK